MIRFIYVAIDAVERGNVHDRRLAVKRAMDIIIHLQARLRMDVGGRPAEALSEFYASIFAQLLQGSQQASKAKFEHAIECVREVRDAWKEVAKDPGVNPPPPQVHSNQAFAMAEDAPLGSHWNA
jgi:flagellar protein FliS